MSSVRGPQRCLACAVAAERALDLVRAGEQRVRRSAVSTAMQALTKGGWSSTPQGGVR